MKIVKTNGIAIEEGGGITIYLDEEFLKYSKTENIIQIEFDVDAVKIDSTFFPGSDSYVKDDEVLLNKSIKIENKQFKKVSINYSYFPFSEKMKELNYTQSVKAMEIKKFKDVKKYPLQTLPWR